MKKNSISYQDLDSLASFREWIVKNTSLYQNDSLPPDQHLAIFLDHIKSKVMENTNIDRRTWLRMVNRLTERIGKIKENENS